MAGFFIYPVVIAQT